MVSPNALVRGCQCAHWWEMVEPLWEEISSEDVRSLRSCFCQGSWVLKPIRSLYIPASMRCKPFMYHYFPPVHSVFPQIQKQQRQVSMDWTHEARQTFPLYLSGIFSQKADHHSGSSRIEISFIQLLYGLLIRQRLLDFTHWYWNQGEELEKIACQYKEEKRK